MFSKCEELGFTFIMLSNQLILPSEAGLKELGVSPITAADVYCGISVSDGGYCDKEYDPGGISDVTMSGVPGPGPGVVTSGHYTLSSD